MTLKKLFQKSNAEEPTINTNQQPELTISMEQEDSCFQGDMAKDLMVLIGKAIDEWAAHYNLENLPKHILFEQVLAVMNSLSRTMDDLR